jgi:hypothetical protein
MAGGIDEDPEASLRSTWRTSGAKREQVLFGLISVSHADVQMYLLGIFRIRPARRNPCGDSLEGELAEAWPGADDHPAAGVLVDPHSQHLTVEIRESARVRTVDHSFLEAPDHTRQHASMQ